MKTNVTVTLKTRPPALLAALLVVTLTMLLAQGSVAAAVSFAKGTYNGLFSQASGTNLIVDHPSSGFLTVRVSDSGAFSGVIYTSPTSSLPGLKHALSGQFDAEGNKTLTLVSKAGFGDLLDLELHYAAPGQTDAITGQVSCANWTAQVLALPAYSSQSPQAGNYTFSLAKPAADPGPEGIGVGKISVSLAGKLAFSGKLPDGTAFTQSLALCQEGRWPLYASLYGGSGSIVGWVDFAGGSSLSGTVGWTKPASPKAKYYSQGLTNGVEIMGLPFIPTRSGSRPLNFKKGLVVFSGGELSTPFTNEVTLSANGRVTDNTSSRLGFKVNRLTGQFTGTAALPGIKGSVPMRGAVFQAPLGQGYGYFLHNGQSGAVQFYGDYR
jgi:hypothetical protein